MYAHQVGVAAVFVPAVERGGKAEVLISAQAKPAETAGAGQPRCTGPVSDLEAVAVRPRGDDFSDGFVARYPPGRAGRQVPFGEVKIGAAYPAGMY
jgi:hypothetical protein